MDTELNFYKNNPKMVLFEITTKCNLNCSYCTARRLIKNPKDLELEKIKMMKSKFDSFEYIAFCGLGEALIHKDFYKILKLFNDKKIVIVTNGSVLIDFKKLSSYKNVETITFSVDAASEDGMKKICDRYRYDILLKNLEKAKKYKIPCAFNTTITESSYTELERIIELIVKYKVKCFKLGLPLGKEKWVHENINQIIERLNIIEKNMGELGVKYEGPFEIKCVCGNAPISVISMNGNLYPCCDYFCKRPLIGNVNNQSFEYLWNKESYNKFRSGEYCKNCKQYHNDNEIKTTVIN